MTDPTFTIPSLSLIITYIIIHYHQQSQLLSFTVIHYYRRHLHPHLHHQASVSASPPFHPSIAPAAMAQHKPPRERILLGGGEKRKGGREGGRVSLALGSASRQSCVCGAGVRTCDGACLCVDCRHGLCVPRAPRQDPAEGGTAGSRSRVLSQRCRSVCE